MKYACSMREMVSIFKEQCSRHDFKQINQKDIRNEPQYRGRSINLALSERGIASLAKVGMEDEILAKGLPMKGRMLHGTTGKLESQLYGLHGECIRSVERRHLNESLLNKAETFKNVQLYFGHKLTRLDLEANKASFIRQDGSTVSIDFEKIVGADGAYSAVRNELMRKTKLNYKQTYIEHSYKELTMPPTTSKEFAMDPVHLHIWPRHEFMMIALPNLDKTFTCTLFAPSNLFDQIRTEEQVLDFFQKNFQDAIPLLGGEKEVLRQFTVNPVGSLMSVECSPHHYEDKLVILGDSAHAMVPFYGQGMNCGFEDLHTLDSLLTKYDEDWSNALTTYSSVRVPAAKAICDLALKNYIEMRHDVATVWYRLRRTITGWAARLSGERILPLYTMVAFTQIPYDEVVRRQNKLQRGVDIFIWTFGVVGTVAMSLSLYSLFGRRAQKTPGVPVEEIGSSLVNLVNGLKDRRVVGNLVAGLQDKLGIMRK